MELNGRPVTAGELAGLALYGYGHFTTMLVRDLRVRGLQWHMDRLQRDCRALFGAELDPARVRGPARRAAGEHPSPSVVRVTVFDPRTDMGRPGAQACPQVLVTTRPAPAPGADPPPVRLGTCLFAREAPQIKSTALFGPLYRRRSAQREGFDDALFTGADGQVSEGPTWNIGFLDGQELVWPQAPSLQGVTARLVGQAAASLGLSVRTGPVTHTECTRMAGAFTTNATTGVRPVASVDGRRIPRSELVRKIAEAYGEIPGDPL